MTTSVGTLEDLDKILVECDAAPTDDALRAIFAQFHMEPSMWVGEGLTLDPLGKDYHASQMNLYQRISGRSYSLKNESTPFDLEIAISRPFPYSTGSVHTAGDHLIAIGQFLRQLDLPSGSRVLELGPGWGNLTLALAALGYDVTAVDIEENFCRLINERARRQNLTITTVNADFSWVGSVNQPFDAIIFFECFHHAADHLGLLRALHHALKPRGRIYLGAEPILSNFPVPWGLRLDGQSLWSIRKFGWMELGFSDAYFYRALDATGWSGTRCDTPTPSTWILRRRDEALRIPTTSPRIRTMTGTRTLTGITVSNQPDGYCLYGPYEYFPPGHYIITVEIDKYSAFSGHATVDVCVDNGLRSLASEDFSADTNILIPTIFITLSDLCNDLEVRLFGKSGFCATLLAITITKTT